MSKQEFYKNWRKILWNQLKEKNYKEQQLMD